MTISVPSPRFLIDSCQKPMFSFQHHALANGAIPMCEDQFRALPLRILKVVRPLDLSQSVLPSLLIVRCVRRPQICNTGPGGISVGTIRMAAESRSAGIAEEWEGDEGRRTHRGICGVSTGSNARGWAGV